MDKTIYKDRRNNLKDTLPENSVLLIPGADLQYRNADSTFPFRQDSSFYYMSGFCEPASLIAIVNNKDGINSIVFVPPKDKLKEIWDGYRSGPIELLMISFLIKLLIITRLTQCYQIFFMAANKFYILLVKNLDLIKKLSIGLRQPLLKIAIVNQ